jgi:hypothetical protein
VLMGLAGVEAYDAYRGFRSDRESMGGEHSSASAVVAHLALSVAQACLKVGLRLGGITMGAAIGVALFPATGATLGAIIGAAGAGMIGKVIFRKISVDLTVKYRLGKICKLSQMRAERAGDTWQSILSYKIDRQEIKLIKRFTLEMRTDKFSLLDEIVEQVTRMPAERRAHLASLKQRIDKKLRFEAVNRHDELMARKLRQLEAAFAGAKTAAE